MKRNELIQFRVSTEEKAELKKRAIAAQTSVADVIREALGWAVSEGAWQGTTKRPIVTSPARTFSEQAEQLIPDIDKPETLTQFGEEERENKAKVRQATEEGKPVDVQVAAGTAAPRPKPAPEDVERLAKRFFGSDPQTTMARARRQAEKELGSEQADRR